MKGKRVVRIKEAKKVLGNWPWTMLPLVVIGGWFYPYLGYLVLICMFGSIGVSFFRGRYWCGQLCPRGVFLDLFMKRFNPQGQLPAWAKSPLTRVGMIFFLFAVVGIQTYLAWGDWARIGLVFVMLLTVTTIAGIIFGLTMQHRTWCAICPMGTIASWIGKDKTPLKVGSNCTGCRICSKVCPMNHQPFTAKEEGFFACGDCLKCNNCVAACPRGALSFACIGEEEKEAKKAA